MRKGGPDPRKEARRRVRRRPYTRWGYRGQANSYCIANIDSIKFKNGGNDIFYTGTNTHVEL